MKTIIEILEIGLPQSLIQRADEPISELIDTERLREELNIQMWEDRQLLKQSYNETQKLYERAKYAEKTISEMNKAYEGFDF